MSLLNPRSTERDNQNALRKFPFTDNSVCGNGSFTITPGAIIDAIIYMHGRDNGRIWISSIGTDGILTLADAAGEFAKTTATAQPNTAVPITFIGNGSPLPGGVIVFGDKNDVSALKELGGQSFSADQTEITSAAVVHLGLSGVLGFKLDDESIVAGDVKFRGENGCDVATFAVAGKKYLRISAIGAGSSEESVTGFITKVVAESDNASFTVNNSIYSDYVIEIQATGSNTVQDNDLNADQDNTCEAVRNSIGTIMSPSATIAPSCGASICDPPTTSHKITFYNGNTVVGTITLLDGSNLGYVNPLKDAHNRFTGYFDNKQEADGNKKIYYNANGVGVGRFTAGKDVKLYAHWMPGASSATVTFENYGGLHLSAPDAVNYANPVIISGLESPIPVIKETTDAEVIAGGADKVSELIMHPTVPSGEVHIGIRGLNKIYAT